MNKLKLNEAAIDFEINDCSGKAINLKQYKGKKVLLSFFRAAPCPFCNMRIQQLIQNYPKLQENNIEVIALFASTADEIAKYAGKQEAPFPIIPDPKLEVYQKYGIEDSQWGLLKIMLKPLEMMKMMASGFFNVKSMKEKPIIPADFLIDEEQNISLAYYGKDFGDHVPINEVLN